MKHELNDELTDLGKRYQGGHISLVRYRSERRAVIDKMASKSTPPPTQRKTGFHWFLIIGGTVFLAAYWLL
jgi:hypothetical protein